MHLFDHKLIVVTGKGGVGRTTLTAALALAAAAAGKRVIALELHGIGALPRALGLPTPDYAARPVAPGVDVMTLSTTACVTDFGRRKLRIGALSNWFFESQLMRQFLEAVPGLRDVVQLGKVENMMMEPLPGEPQYDLAVLDAPATGHGLTLLASARAMGQMTRVGPFHDLASTIDRFMGDPSKTAFATVSLPEALPINESLELVDALQADHAPPKLFVVNRVHPSALEHNPSDSHGSAQIKRAADTHAGLAAPLSTLAGIAASEEAVATAEANALAGLPARLADRVTPPPAVVSVRRDSTVAAHGRLTSLVQDLERQLHGAA